MCEGPEPEGRCTGKMAIRSSDHLSCGSKAQQSCGLKAQQSFLSISFRENNFPDIAKLEKPLEFPGHFLQSLCFN